MCCAQPFAAGRLSLRSAFEFRFHRRLFVSRDAQGMTRSVATRRGVGRMRTRPEGRASIFLHDVTSQTFRISNVTTTRWRVWPEPSEERTGFSIFFSYLPTPFFLSSFSRQSSKTRFDVENIEPIVTNELWCFVAYAIGRTRVIVKIGISFYWVLEFSSLSLSPPTQKIVQSDFGREHIAITEESNVRPVQSLTSRCWLSFAENGFSNEMIRCFESFREVEHYFAPKSVAMNARRPISVSISFLWIKALFWFIFN